MRQTLFEWSALSLNWLPNKNFILKLSQAMTNSASYQLGFLDYVIKMFSSESPSFWLKYVNAYDKLISKVFCSIWESSLVGWLVGWYLWHIKLCAFFNAKSIFIQIITFQTIRLSWVHSLTVKISSFSSYSVYSNSTNSTNSVQNKYSHCHSKINIKRVLFQTFQFSVNTISMSKTVLLKNHFSGITVTISKTVLSQTIQLCISR